MALGFLSFTARSQFDPLYSQYRFNIQAFNPAYTGVWENMGLTLLGREQYLGFDNNPATRTVSLQIPVMEGKMGTGFTLINDGAGHLQRTQLMVDYAYGIRLSPSLTWRWGITAGMCQYRNNWAQYLLNHPDDPAFIGDSEGIYLPNVGIGTFLHSQLFYLGISVPSLLNNQQNDYQNELNPQQFHAMAGVVVPLFNGLDLKPSAHLRYHRSGTWVADVNFSLLVANKLWLGASYRTSDELSWAINTSFLIGEQLRIGYAYDMMKNNGWGVMGAGAHEFMLSYEFKWEKTTFVSPRYF